MSDFDAGNGQSLNRRLGGGPEYGRPWQQPDTVGEPVAPLDIHELLRVLRRHALLILAITAVCTGGAVYWARSVGMLYSAKAVIRLKDTRRAMTGGLSEGPMDALVGPQIDPLLSQIEMLQSRSVAGEVIDSVPELRLRTAGFPVTTLRHLDIATADARDSITLKFATAGFTVSDHGRAQRAQYGEDVHLGGITFQVEAPPDKDSGRLEVLSRDGSIVRLLKSLQIKPRESTDVVDVTFLDADPALAQRTVNQVVDVFQRSSAQTSQKESVRRRVFLEEQLRYQDSILGRARLDLSAFKGRQRAFSAKARFATEQESLKGLDVRRQELDAQRQIIKELLGHLADPSSSASEGMGALLAAPDIAANPTIQTLYTQLVKYQASHDSLTVGRWAKGAKNPDVVRLDELIASTQGQLLGAFRGLLTSLDARIQSLDQLKANSSTSFPELSATEEQESGLEERVASAQRTVEQLRTEYERARLSEAVEVGEVELIDHAALPSDADGVRPILRVIFGMLVGVVFGLAAACILEYLNKSIRRRNQVHSTLGLSELAIIPQLSPGIRTRLAGSIGNGAAKAAKSRAVQASTLVTATDAHSIGAEAYRVLRTSLLFSHPSESPRTILITSPTPGDGKTTVASNLAVTFAQQGIRTLLVDCDLRRGRLNSVFRTPRDPGLSDLLMGKTDLEAAIRVTKESGLSLLPTGTIPRAPAELLGSPRMRELVRTLLQRYEVIILDSAPVLAASDAAIVAAISDGTVMVLRAGKTQEEEAHLALARLAGVGAHVIGAVVNDQNSTLKSYGGYYPSKYYGATE